MKDERPRVGVGVYVRKQGKLLFGKRLSSHGVGTWSAPGGKLEMNEDPEVCAHREVREETGLQIQNLRFVGFTNDLFESGKHYITLSYVADWKDGELQNMEPDKCEKWEWFGWDELPEPKFLSLENFVALGINPLEFKA